MTKAIEILMNEHRLIERVLGSLDTWGREVRGGLAVERPTAARFATFFRDFADTRHHGKEEDILFRRMTERGFPTQGGPIAVMLHEHVLGREHVGSLRAVGTGTEPVGASDAAAILAVADGYVPLLSAHIQKEDNILYPMAEQVLADADFAVMAEEFERLERTLRGDGSRDPLLALADSLAADFPADPVRMAAVTAGGGCGFGRR